MGCFDFLSGADVFFSPARRAFTGDEFTSGAAGIPASCRSTARPVGELNTQFHLETLMPKLMVEGRLGKASLAVQEADPIQSMDLLEFSLPDGVLSWRYQVLKRAFDLLFSAILISLFAVPGLFIALAIRLTSQGPVFYRETRIGRNGREFRIWKFRSMRCRPPRKARAFAAHAGGSVREWRMKKQATDPRITPIGKFLRRWSLDELPQLMNVFLGDMSLIGPRPIVSAEIGFYGNLFAYYLAVLPGLSGLWQVSGRSDIDYPLRAQLDAIYVGTWSLASDFLIVFRTIPAVLGRRGAR
jgi:exopolysaccharide production protein ExoY